MDGRPLGTTIPGPLLVAAAASSVAAACAIGIAVAATTTWWLLVAIVVGAALVPLYNLELLGGALHHDLGFALSWGAFPVVTAYLAQTGTVTGEAILVAGWATALSLAQRRLSTAARWARRDVETIEGTAVLRDGTAVELDRAQTPCRTRDRVALADRCNDPVRRRPRRVAALGSSLMAAQATSALGAFTIDT